MRTDYLSRSDARAPVAVFRRGRSLAALLSMVVLVACTGLTVCAQRSRAEVRAKLPAPDKIINEYWKAVGGKKRLAGLNVATYEWTIEGQTNGGARIRERAPSSARTDLTFESGEVSSAASARSAWTRGADGRLRTLTDAEAGAAKLQAALSASHLIDYRKLNVLARTLAVERTDAEDAYVVEFSTRAGARLRYLFGVRSKLLLKIEDEARKVTTRLADYRAEGGVLVPHRLQIERAGAPGDLPASLLLNLRRAAFDANFSDAVFDPPSSEAVDIPALLREVEKNQDKLDERIAEYAFTEKRTERKISDKGEIKEEKVTVYEIYPLPGGGSFYKLISENGVPLSAERAAKQDKNIAESVEKYESAREKSEQKKKQLEEKNGGPLPVEKKKDDDDDVTVAQFLRACEFVSPRRERLRDRETVVFDFRPRAGFRPSNRAEDIITKLIGIVWIDPVDKQVMRLEAKLAEGFKMGGGLVASIKPGAFFIFEQTRLGDGVWLPRFAQVNFSAKVLLFKSIEANETREFSDYRHFETETKDYKLDAPAAAAPAPPKP